jgi:adsorption protein B
MVAAWHEDNVIEDVITNMVSSMQYPRSFYHVFIGVYPNDEPTINAAKRLEEKYKNVHMVINLRPGPTCKADNINNIIRHIKQFESERNWRFASITVHDSEDVVHPQELKLTNYLIESYDALQFPVIPLQKMPSIKNFFTSMTTGTYADEFAENHFRIVEMREAMSALVPSAGTGFAISHDILDYYGDEPLFPEDSLTEDYKLSLTLTKLGFKIHYVLEKVPRLMDSGKTHWDYVATRSFFPETFSAAVRQKTRWIYGITMQSVRAADIFMPSKLSLAGRYSLYKDLKSKIGNLIILPGYLVFVYFIVDIFLPLPVMYPQGTLAWKMCLFLTFLMIFRQFWRAVSITNFYGLRSMVVACLLPPLLPIRLVWANIINMSATFNAWKLRLFGAGRKSKKKKVAWSKTDHKFLHKLVLFTYYRNVGDVLLEREYISSRWLKIALDFSRQKKIRLGQALLDSKLVTEAQLMEALAAVKHRLFVKDLTYYHNALTDKFDKDALERLLIYPLLKAGESYVFAMTDVSETEKIPELLGIKLSSCIFVYSTKFAILGAIKEKAGAASQEYKYINAFLENGQIVWDQALHALANYNYSEDILKFMGLNADNTKTVPRIMK